MKLMSQMAWSSKVVRTFRLAVPQVANLLVIYICFQLVFIQYAAHNFGPYADVFGYSNWAQPLWTS